MYRAGGGPLLAGRQFKIQRSPLPGWHQLSCRTMPVADISVVLPPFPGGLGSPATSPCPRGGPVPAPGSFSLLHGKPSRLRGGAESWASCFSAFPATSTRKHEWVCTGSRAGQGCGQHGPHVRSGGSPFYPQTLAPLGFALRHCEGGQGEDKGRGAAGATCTLTPGPRGAPSPRVGP